MLMLPDWIPESRPAKKTAAAAPKLNVNVLPLPNISQESRLVVNGSPTPQY